MLLVYYSVTFQTNSRVKIFYILSDYNTMSIGVPRGTIHGPLIVYVNDLLIDILGGTIVCDADNTVLLAENDNGLGAKNKINAYLYKVTNRVIVNKYSLNTKKVFIAFGNYRNSVLIILTL